MGSVCFALIGSRWSRGFRVPSVGAMGVGAMGVGAMGVGAMGVDAMGVEARGVGFVIVDRLGLLIIGAVVVEAMVL